LEGPDDGGEAKRRRLTDGTFGLQGYEAPDEIWYNRDKLLEAPQAIQEAVESTDDKEIFSEGTLARLKALKNKEIKKPAPPTNGGLLGFEDYGSDEDEDED
jgi:hypothetical protein